MSDLNYLFDKAKKSLQAEMPINEVEQLIDKANSNSLQNHKKNWIMISTILGSILLSIYVLTNTALISPTTLTTKNVTDTTTTAKAAMLVTQLDEAAEADSVFTLFPAKLAPISLPEAPSMDIPENESTDTQGTVSPPPPVPEKPDSLEPKKNFTEYALVIRKENSKEEIDKLKTELQQYGINMKVVQLTYNPNNTIKRFKGVFDTDSLFCGDKIQQHEFDINGEFREIQFTFRVAQNEQLKYLKIQSDNFEDVIECYEDEVIADAKTAQEIQERIRIEMQDMEDQKRLIEIEMDSAKALIRHKLKALEETRRLDWAKIAGDVERQLKNRFNKKQLAKIKEQLQSLDEKIDIKPDQINDFNWDDIIEIDLDLGDGIFNWDNKDIIHLDSLGNTIIIEKNGSLKHSAEELEEKAKALEAEAKALRKAAKKAKKKTAKKRK